jgi:AAA-like domain
MSEMFIREIELARRIATTQQGLPRLLPVRVAFTDALPYPLSASIGSLQYARWDSDDDTGRLLASIEKSLKNDSRALGSSPPETSELSLGLRPLPRAQIYRGIGGGTGTLATDDLFYVKRAADDTGVSTLRSGPGQTISIKGSRQIGKSSLFVRLLDEALKEGRRAAYIDFGLLNGTWESASSFFRYFAAAIAQELKLPGPAGDAWEAQSPAISCTSFMETHVLGRVNGPLTLGCDEVDVVWGSGFSNEFFSMLRSWHNRRARPAIRGTNPWKSLDILLVTSTEPYLLIDRSEQSPFNVGTVLSLEDFTIDELWQLNERLEKPLQAREDVQQLHELMGGQAYLSRRALHLMTPEGGGMSLPQLQARAHDGQGPFGDHLRMLLSKVVDSDKLVAAFKVVLEGRGDSMKNHEQSLKKHEQSLKEHEPSLLKLTSAGLLRRSEEGFVPRCGLYAKYFRDRLASHG